MFGNYRRTWTFIEESFIKQFAWTHVKTIRWKNIMSVIFVDFRASNSLLINRNLRVRSRLLLIIHVISIIEPQICIQIYIFVNTTERTVLLTIIIIPSNASNWNKENKNSKTKILKTTNKIFRIYLSQYKYLSSNERRILGYWKYQRISLVFVTIEIQEHKKTNFYRASNKKISIKD